MQNKLFKRVLTGVLSAALVVGGVVAPKTDDVQAKAKVKAIEIGYIDAAGTAKVVESDSVVEVKYPANATEVEAQAFVLGLEGNAKGVKKGAVVKIGSEKAKLNDGDPFVVTQSEVGKDETVNVMATTKAKTKKNKKLKVKFAVSFAKDAEWITVDSVEATIDKDTIGVGETATISATVKPEGAADITFTSSDEKVATVDEKGVVTGVAAGSATITVAAGDKSADVKVTVTGEEPEPEPADELNGVSLDITAPKVGDTINAITDPVKVKDVTYVWESLDTSASEEGTVIGNSESIVVTANEVGKFIRVTATAGEGELVTSFKAVTTSAVTEDKSASVTVADLNGLQADGTGLVTDVLSLSYGSGLGVPALITWYYNDTVVKSATSQAVGFDRILQLDPDAEVQATKFDGNYYAVITNDKGETFTSNTIALVYDELPAQISGIGITDDLTNAANITYDKADDKAVVTVKMKKFYGGKYYLYESTIENYSSTNATAVLDTNDLTTGAFWMPTLDKMTEGNAIKYDNVSYDFIAYVAPNGETTMMFVAPDALDRGKSYKLVFDQKEIKTDDIGATARKDVTATEAVEEAYLTAPAGVELVTVTPGSAATAKLVDAEGNTVTYIGEAKTGTTIAAAGFSSFKVFGNSSASKDGATSKAAGTKVKAGVVETGDLGDADYYYAELKTKAGVYGKESATLESKFKAANVSIVKEIKVAEDATTPEKANITLKGVVAPSKVYVVNTSDKNFVAAGGFDPNDSSTYRGVVDVEAGQANASIDSVITDEDFGTDFVAWIVPADEAVYARQSSDAFTLKHVATSLEYDGDGTAATVVNSVAHANTHVDINGNKEIVVKDQFGKAITSGTDFDAVTAKTATSKVVDNTSDIHETTEAEYSIVGGALLLTFKETAGTDINDGYDFTVLGSTISVRAKNNTAAAGADTSAIYEVKLGSNTVQTATLGATPAFAVASIGAFTNAVSVANGVASATCAPVITLASGSPLTLNSDLTIAKYVKVDIASGAVGDGLTVAAGATLTNKGTLELSKDTTAANKAAALTVAGAYVSEGGTLTLEADATGPGNIAASTGKFYTDDATEIAKFNSANVTGEVHATKTLTLPTWATCAGKFVVDKGATVTLTDGNDVFAKGLEVNGGLVATKTGVNTTKITTTYGLKVATDATLTDSVFTGTAGETYTLSDGTSTVTLQGTAPGAGTTTVSYATKKAIETSTATGAVATFKVEVESGVVYLTTT